MEKIIFTVFMVKHFVYNYKRVHINTKTAFIDYPTIHMIKHTKKGLKR